jgi:hypothetical protein
VQDNHWHGYQNVNAEALTLSTAQATMNDFSSNLSADGGLRKNEKSRFAGLVEITVGFTDSKSLERGRRIPEKRKRKICGA